MQTVENAIGFLLKEANIAIRYRVVKELYNDTRSVEYFKLKQELENSERTKKLLEYLSNHKEYCGHSFPFKSRSS